MLLYPVSTLFCEKSEISGSKQGKTLWNDDKCTKNRRKIPHTPLSRSTFAPAGSVRPGTSWWARASASRCPTSSRTSCTCSSPATWLSARGSARDSGQLGFLLNLITKKIDSCECKWEYRSIWSLTCFCWHCNNICASVKAYFAVAELLICCQQTVFRDQMDHTTL